MIIRSRIAGRRPIGFQMIKAVVIGVVVSGLAVIGRVGFVSSEATNDLRADAELVASCAEDARGWAVMAGTLDEVHRQDALKRWATEFHQQAQPSTRDDAVNALVKAVQRGKAFDADDLEELLEVCAEFAGDEQRAHGTSGLF